MCGVVWSRVCYIALSLVLYNLASCEFLGFKNLPITSFRLNNMLTSAVYDMTDLHKICGDQRYSSQQGVEKTIKWIES